MGESLLEQGVGLMIYGIGTVFVFLALLVVGIALMSTLIGKFFVEHEPLAVRNERKKITDSVPLASGAVDREMLDVIQDAIYQHRAKHQA